MTPKGVRRRAIRWLTFLTLVWGALQLVAWKMSSGHEASDRFSRTAVFGGNEFTSVASGLRSGEIKAILGGISLDLTGAELDPAGADLSLSCKLAGIAIAVPPQWRVTGIEQSRMVSLELPDPNELPDDAPELRIRVSSILGGVAISA